MHGEILFQNPKVNNISNKLQNVTQLCCVHSQIHNKGGIISVAASLHQTWSNSTHSLHKKSNTDHIILTLSKCCCKLCFTWTRSAVSIPEVVFKHLVRVPISSSASSPRNIRSSRFPTDKTYSS